MTETSRIYLDNAATSWPKPEAVYRAVDRYQRENGAPAGRSVYREAMETQRLIDETRTRTARFFGAASPRHVIFAGNGTDALNLAIHGLLRPGDHVVTSVVEHNSVLRPLRFWEAERGVSLTFLPCNSAGIVSIDELRNQLRPETRLVVLSHVSNVTGARQPVAEAGELLGGHAALFLVDAAQSAGHLPVEIGAIGCNLIATPGHKGLYGPLGTGLLVLDELAAAEIKPTRQGGTGTISQSDRQPDTLPDRLEAGNLNVPGIVGLGKGIEFVDSTSLEEIEPYENEMAETLVDGLQEIPGLTVYGPRDPEHRTGVVSVAIDGYDPQEMAALLDSSFGIQGRGGLHCAPRMHEALGTLSAGGTMRFSLGIFNDRPDVDAVVAAVREIASFDR